MIYFVPIDTFTIEELEHLMDEFNVEHLEEIELDQFEENFSNIESVNCITSIQKNNINNVNLTEKRHTMAKESSNHIFF